MNTDHSRLSKRCFVYWIHLPSHSDLTSEGYIGITTTTVDKRFKDHTSAAKTTKFNYPIHNAIKKYGDDLIVTTLIEGSLEYCQLMELKLRPSEKIGWNLTKGGGFPIDMTGRRHTEEAKKKISEASKRDAHTPAKIAAYERKKGVKRPAHVIEAVRQHNKSLPFWLAGKSNRDIWSIADIIFLKHKQHPEFGAIKLSKLLNLTEKNIENMLDKFRKQNWNPLQDDKWLEWSKNYKLNKGN